MNVIKAQGTINGFYFCVDINDCVWYVAHGSHTVNITTDTIENIPNCIDFSCCSYGWEGEGTQSIDSLVKHVQFMFTENGSNPYP